MKQRLKATGGMIWELLKRLYERHGPVNWVAFFIGAAGGTVLWAICFVIQHFSLKMLEIPSGLEYSVRLAAEQDLWRTALQLGGGLLVFVGLALTAWRINVNSRQVQAIEDGQVTERFTKAIEQLGAFRPNSDKPNLEVRLGGIFALERIARDSPKDHWTVMEVLAAYVRENAPELKPRAEIAGRQLKVLKTKEGNKYEKPRSDVQAALKVIGRRKDRIEQECIDLNTTHLCGADLVKAKLGRAMLFEANLRHALLFDAILVGASMFEADLSNAVLVGGDLRDVDLKEAILQETDLREVNLRGARDLTPEQLAVAIIDRNTILPENLEQYQDKLLETSEANLARAISEGRMTPDAVWQKP